VYSSLLLPRPSNDHHAREFHGEAVIGVVLSFVFSGEGVAVGEATEFLRGQRDARLR